MVAGTEQPGSRAIQAERHFEWLSLLLLFAERSVMDDARMLSHSSQPLLDSFTIIFRYFFLSLK